MTRIHRYSIRGSQKWLRWIVQWTTFWVNRSIIFFRSVTLSNFGEAKFACSCEISSSLPPLSSNLRVQRRTAVRRLGSVSNGEAIFLFGSSSSLYLSSHVSRASFRIHWHWYTKELLYAMLDTTTTSFSIDHRAFWFSNIWPIHLRKLIPHKLKIFFCRASEHLSVSSYSSWNSSLSGFYICCAFNSCSLWWWSCRLVANCSKKSELF